MNTQIKVGQTVTVNGKSLSVVGKDGGDFVVMEVSKSGAIREYLLDASGKLQRIN